MLLISRLSMKKKKRDRRGARPQTRHAFKKKGQANNPFLYISEEISAKAMFAVEQHFLSHSMQLADALIGATAINYGLPLLTENDKHYKIMKGIQLKRFRP